MGHSLQNLQIVSALRILSVSSEVMRCYRDQNRTTRLERRFRRAKACLSPLKGVSHNFSANILSGLASCSAGRYDSILVSASRQIRS